MVATKGKLEGDKAGKKVDIIYGKKRNERPISEVSLLGVRTILRLERDAQSMG